MGSAKESAPTVVSAILTAAIIFFFFFFFCFFAVTPPMSPGICILFRTSRLSSTRKLMLLYRAPEGCPMRSRFEVPTRALFFLEGTPAPSPVYRRLSPRTDASVSVTISGGVDPLSPSDNSPPFPHGVQLVSFFDLASQVGLPFPLRFLFFILPSLSFFRMPPFLPVYFCHRARECSPLGVL